MKKPKECPKCKSANVKNIVYGEPMAEPKDDEVLGGCIVEKEEWHCGDCRWEWGHGGRSGGMGSVFIYDASKARNDDGHYAEPEEEENMDKKKIVKLILIGLVILLFIISIPGVFLNGRGLNKAEDYARVVLDEASKICNSNCTDYPKEWVMGGKEAEAKLYCMNQCSNNMEGLRQTLASDLKPTMFTNQYSYRVEQVYCILGLRCVSREIEDFVSGYKL